jgi:hypothetical protein
MHFFKFCKSPAYIFIFISILILYAIYDGSEFFLEFCALSSIALFLAFNYLFFKCSNQHLYLRLSVLTINVFSLTVVLFMCVDFDLVKYHLTYYFIIVQWFLGPTCVVDSSSIDVVALQIKPADTWEDLIADFLKNVQHNPNINKWVVVKHSVDLGLCNRILYSMSLLLYAIASRRKIWFEWDREEPRFITRNEYAGSSRYGDLFDSEFTNFTTKFPWLEIERLPSQDKCSYEQVLFSRNLNQIPDKFIRLDGGDWWGSLIFHNQFYRKSIFRNLNVKQGIPVMFRSLFTPKVPVEPKQCSWMIQYRSIWPRKTASVDYFLRCARKHGLTSEMYSSTYIITDDPNAMLASAKSEQTVNILSKMHIPTKATCRGECGDTDSIKLMFEMSQCQHAVLTLGSSFGACPASLAAVKTMYKVGYMGHCIPQDTEEGPMDQNCEDYRGAKSTFLTRFY